MNKIITVTALVFAFTLGTVFSADIATALKPATEVLVTNTEPIPVTGSISSDPACPAENVQHWMAVPFQTSGSLGSSTLIHSTLPDIRGSRQVEIEMQYDPEVATDVVNELVDHLTSLGYTKSLGVPLDAGVITSVGNPHYSTICAEN